MAACLSLAEANPGNSVKETKQNLNQRISKEIIAVVVHTQPRHHPLQVQRHPPELPHQKQLPQVQLRLERLQN